MNWMRRESPIDPRVAVLFVFFFAVIVAVSHSWWTLGTAWVITILCSAFFASDWKQSLSRCVALSPLIVLVWLMVPWSWSWTEGSFWPVLGVSREGVDLAARISVRAVAILFVASSILLTLGPERLVLGLRGVGVPDRFGQLLAMTVRFLPLVTDEYARLRTAMVSRGFQNRVSLNGYRDIAASMGMLLIRSLDRSERVRDAIDARSFGRPATPRPLEWDRWDWIAATLAACAIACLIAIELATRS